MGFAVTIAAVLLWFMDWRWALSIAFTIGSVIFGVSMGFRAYLDEVMTEADRRAMLEDIEKLKESRSLLEQRLRVAQSDLQSAQAELLLRMGSSRTRTAIDLTPRTELTSEEEAIRRNAEKLLHQAYSTGKWGKDTAKAKLNEGHDDRPWSCVQVKRQYDAHGKHPGGSSQPTFEEHQSSRGIRAKRN